MFLWFFIKVDKNYFIKFYVKLGFSNTFYRNVRGDTNLYKGGKENDITFYGGRSLFDATTHSNFFEKLEFNTLQSVRTRNTLHIVVARKSSICYNAVEGRKRWRKEKKEKRK